MTRLATAFGDISRLRTRTFTLGDHAFSVRIPLTSEMESMVERIEQPEPEKFAARFAKITAAMTESDAAVTQGDDVLVDGKSTRELVTTVLRAEKRITEYFKLLVPAQGQSMADITYDDIEAELPFAVQMEVLNAISEAIQPGYKDAKKN